MIVIIDNGFVLLHLYQSYWIIERIVFVKTIISVCSLAEVLLESWFLSNCWLDFVHNILVSRWFRCIHHTNEIRLYRCRVAFALSQSSFNHLLLTLCLSLWEKFCRSLLLLPRNNFHIVLTWWFWLINYRGRWTANCMLLLKIFITIVIGICKHSLASHSSTRITHIKVLLQYLLMNFSRVSRAWQDVA